MNLIIKLLLFVSFTSFLPSAIEKEQPKFDSLPFDMQEKTLKPLKETTDFNMQGYLEKKLFENKKWKQLIKNDKMAVGIVDLRNPQKVRLATVNGDVMMYAASLPKIAVLLAAMQAIDDGKIKETEKVKDDLRLMIARSDNQASTRMIDRLGYDQIESVLTNPRYNLYDEDFGGGLWVGKRYSKSGPRNPDPMLGLSHAATVFQVCRFYYLLAFGKLVSFERSEEMLDIMVDPELHHKFVNVLEKIAPDAKLYRKSGTWQNWHSDSILVWDTDWRRYILVALIEDSNGSEIIKSLVPIAENVLRHSNKIELK